MEKMILHYKAMWKNWSDFQGKTDVPSYWWAILAHFLIMVILAFLSQIFGNVAVLGTLLGWASFVFGLLVLIPGIAITVRRLHDTGRSGLWMLIFFVPLVGWIILLVFLIQPSKN